MARLYPNALAKTDIESIKLNFLQRSDRPMCVLGMDTGLLDTSLSEIDLLQRSQ